MRRDIDLMRKLLLEAVDSGGSLVPLSPVGHHEHRRLLQELGLLNLESELKQEPPQPGWFGRIHYEPAWHVGDRVYATSAGIAVAELLRDDGAWARVRALSNEMGDLPWDLVIDVARGHQRERIAQAALGEEWARITDRCDP